jgi:hypothetical protein
LWVALLALLGAACSGVEGSAVATGRTRAPHAGRVVLVALSVPEDAEELGVVQARGAGELEDLAQEFRAQAASLGGDLAKVDAIKSKAELTTQSYSYACGKATCTGVRTVEVVTTQILGRAFRRR